MAKLTKEQKERIKESMVLIKQTHLTALHGLQMLYAIEKDPEKCKKIEEIWKKLTESW